MAPYKTAAAYLAYFAYIDDGDDTVLAKHFRDCLRDKVPAGDANGPWTLTWGPAVNDGTLAYVARGADGTYALAFRGTNTDADVIGAFQNYLEDLEAFNFVPWPYQRDRTPAPQISAGTNQALALAIAAVDPATTLGLLDYVRSLALNEPVKLIVTGHSLGAALAVAATAWLHDQVPKLEPLDVTLLPYTFATPSTWDQAFADWFGTTFPYYAAVNGNDIVPMAWANLAGVLATFPQPGPVLWKTDPILYALIDVAANSIPQFTAIGASDPDLFTIAPEKHEGWVAEAGAMHSMALRYFPHATGTTAPPLPDTLIGGAPKPRAASPA